MTKKEIWIQIQNEKQYDEILTEIFDFQEQFDGKLEIIIYSKKNNSKKSLGGLCRLSENAIPALVEKYGEDNVKLVEREKTPKYIPPVVKSPELRIAEALENIYYVLEDMQNNIEILSSAIGQEGNGSYLYIKGAVNSYND